MQKNTTSGFSSTTKPFTALLAGARFLANLEETKHVFTIFDAIDGKQTEQNYLQYVRSDTGAGLDKEGVNFSELLCDRQYLESFGEGSLADAYLKFLSVENLDLELLMLAERNANTGTLNVDKSRRIFITTGFAVHDLLHVITGYGRDPLGEACVLTFTAEQMNLRGLRILAHAMALREKANKPAMPVMKMIDEAKARGAQCEWIPNVDWREFFGLTVEEARLKLGVQPSKLYEIQGEQNTDTDSGDIAYSKEHAA